MIRGEKLLRGLHRILPLGRKYHRLFSALNGRRGLLAIPFDRCRLVQPTAWAKQITNQLLNGVDVVPEFSLLAPLVRQLSSGCLIDVGANIGLYTLLLRSVSSLPIIAYEPQPFLFKLLRFNIAFNQLANVEARNFACGSHRGEVPFSIGINGSVAVDAEASGAALPGDDLESEAEKTQRGQAVIRVPLTTLDEDLAEAPAIALLKIDCEGFEHEILQGARRLIQRHKPRLFVEVHPPLLGRFGHSVEDLLKLLQPYYELEFWCFERIYSHSKFRESVAKFLRPKGRLYRDAVQMLAAADSDKPPGQVYVVGRPTGKFLVTGGGRILPQAEQLVWCLRNNYTFAAMDFGRRLGASDEHIP